MLTIIFISTGILFILISSLGIIRMPDVYTRMSVVAKAITLGVGFILLGVIFHFEDNSTLVKAVVIVVFLSLSTSVAASVIAIAAYNDKDTKLSDRTIIDEMSAEEFRQADKDH